MTEQEMKIVRTAARRRLGNRGADMMLREITLALAELESDAPPLEMAEAEIDKEK